MHRGTVGGTLTHSKGNDSRTKRREVVQPRDRGGGPSFAPPRKQALSACIDGQRSTAAASASVAAGEWRSPAPMAYSYSSVLSCSPAMPPSRLAISLTRSRFSIVLQLTSNVRVAELLRSWLQFEPQAKYIDKLNFIQALSRAA
jgi:hypothetical protein